MHLRKILVLLFILVGCGTVTSYPWPVYQSSHEITDVELIEVLEDKTVRIEVSCFGFGFSSHSYGSGAIVLTTGHTIIATASHVVDKHGICTINVITVDGSKYVASVVSLDTDHDAALVKVAGHSLGSNTPIEIESTRGEAVTCLGWPISLLNKSGKYLAITRGHITSLDIVPDVRPKHRLHRVSAVVYFGNSGGGCYTDSGALVGTVTAMYGGRDTSGKYFAHPGNFFITPARYHKKLLDKI